MEALNRNPDDIRTNTAIGNHYLKNGDYYKAKEIPGACNKNVNKRLYTPVQTVSFIFAGINRAKNLGLYKEAVDTFTVQPGITHFTRRLSRASSSAITATGVCSGSFVFSIPSTVSTPVQTQTGNIPLFSNPIYSLVLVPISPVAILLIATQHSSIYQFFFAFQF